MFLTRAFLDPTSRAVRADAKNPEGLHKTVMRAFPEDAGPSPRAKFGVLHRLDEDRGRVVLLVQSTVRPSVTQWPTGYVLNLGDDMDQGFSSISENPSIRDVAAERGRIAVGQRFVFRLRANTTRKIDTKSASDGTRRHGRRVPVRGEEARNAWLVRKATSLGFAVDAAKLRTTELGAVSSGGGSGVTLAGAMFDGILEVTDADAFRASLAAGIGPAKAYGFGLLSIASVR
jgi:CRISPR system Cascade subunit CasE